MKKSSPQFTPEGFFHKIREVFDQSTSDQKETRDGIPVADFLMSALAMFSLKYPSLLQFEKDRASEPTLRHNLKTLYGIEKAPCDTYLRERLDDVQTDEVRPALKAIIALLQRSKKLENWKFLDDYYLVSLDGTGFFSSDKIKCDGCCHTVHNRGKSNEYTSYHHKMLVGSIVHPDIKQVLPIGFEPITRADGEVKNDCERNAGKRWMDAFRKDHPQLKTVILGDGLYSNAPFLRKVLESRCSYLCVARDDDHKALNEYFWAASAPDMTELCETSHGITKKYRFMENVPINDANSDFLVTVVYYEQTDAAGKQMKWTWVTNLKVDKNNVRRIVAGARARFKIENETFNTLKNQGYNLEHNYGHGYKNLSNIFAILMLTAFLVDQCLESFNLEFQKSLTKCASRIRLWNKISAFFSNFYITTWDKLHAAILDPPYPVL